MFNTTGEYYGRIKYILKSHKEIEKSIFWKGTIVKKYKTYPHISISLPGWNRQYPVINIKWMWLLSRQLPKVDLGPA